MGDTSKRTELHDGHSDGFEPVLSLDLGKCDTVSDLLKGMSNTAFAGRRLGEAADVLHEMVKDKDCFKVLTLSGAMTVAKMGLVICDMIDNGMVDVIISTGALMAHGFIEAAGMTHFKYKDEMDDAELYEKGYNRVYDTIELEKNLDDAEVVIKEVLRNYEKSGESKETCSYMVNEKLGEYLYKKVKGRGVLKSAYEKKVPVYIPAFTDSEFGLDFAIYLKKAEIEKRDPLKFNPFLDLEDYTERIKRSKKLGIFTIGGGVPRNWAQQVGPYLDILMKRMEQEEILKRFHYGIRICPEPVHWGGLSGCTYSEGVSWGKFVPQSEGGRQVEVYADATIAWPLVVKAVLERMKK